MKFGPVEFLFLGYPRVAWLLKLQITLQQIIMALLKFLNVWSGKVCQNKQCFNYHIIREEGAKISIKRE